MSLVSGTPAGLTVAKQYFAQVAIGASAIPQIADSLITPASVVMLTMTGAADATLASLIVRLGTGTINASTAALVSSAATLAVATAVVNCTITVIKY
tara:strand:- start:5255 stop:5545 length:291 start_codon:yes stop_codon:yes gene_type:complete